MKSVTKGRVIVAIPLLLAAAPPTEVPPPPTAPAITTPKTTTAQSVGGAAFPDAVSPKYAKETAGKQRMHTCLDQYHANKSTGGNGGLKWIQKGGGYYSACLKHLKGA